VTEIAKVVGRVRQKGVNSGHIPERNPASTGCVTARAKKLCAGIAGDGFGYYAALPSPFRLRSCGA